MEHNNYSSASSAVISAVSSASHLPEPDVHILTSGGLRIPAHTGILAMASPVLENIIERPRKHRSSERVIPILGVPCDAVSAFVEYLYSSRCDEEQLAKYGIHLLALSHVYSVPPLKQRCSRGVSQRLTAENAVDVLQLARLCDAPDLYLKCMKYIAAHFKSVEQTEGWSFMQDHDPWLELQILQFIDEAETRKKRIRRHREAQSLYLQLSEAMECLQHICTEGCTTVGPYDVKPAKKPGPCNKYATCHGVQLLIKHFALCKRRVNGGGCSRCKRMWQLLRLHSSICDHPDSCRVPLCRQFKVKAHRQKMDDDAKWKVLVKKVLAAKAVSSLAIPKRKREDEERETMGTHHHHHHHHHQVLRTFRLR
ncbi:BTB/POZ and TAZ domain-containing protein 2 [Hibiscus syriacus]|uniref:BTB/POZ and TAZ domain-containing protein 2 n=2 Tax=Hibiscus syriacus TaxID=106335 RepID=A0A6A3C369_HIBSY|nr:BTB/POZ and TAZ domain-containing protein 1-like isoform X1 [Hibiscus syriacus]KAE8721539.1 BTB/POZ and TAZ domain-containing protein 2 [Hibiscus syriacus]